VSVVTGVEIARDWLAEMLVDSYMCIARCNSAVNAQKLCTDGQEMKGLIITVMHVAQP
jgi:hypothetical protein